MTQFPIITLAKAVERLSRAYAIAGAGSAYDRAAFALALGYTNPQSGRFASLMTNLQLYGLVERAGSRYAFSALFTRIFTAQDGFEGRAAMRRAALTPPPFRSLYDSFVGKRMPPDISRWFLHAYHGDVSESAATVSSRVFTETMTAVGVLKDGVLLDVSSNDSTVGGLVGNPVNSPVQSDTGIPMNTSHAAPEHGAMSGVLSPTSSRLTVSSLEKDFGGGRVARVIIPADLTQDERDILMALIQYL